MIYTHLTLFGLGIVGILLHNLVKLDEINRAKKGKANLLKYLSLEKFSIVINLLVVIVCVVLSQEIKETYQLGKLMGIPFFMIGYMGQSLLVSRMGKAKKELGS